MVYQKFSGWKVIAFLTEGATKMEFKEMTQVLGMIYLHVIPWGLGSTDKLIFFKFMLIYTACAEKHEAVTLRNTWRCNILNTNVSTVQYIFEKFYVFSWKKLNRNQPKYLHTCDAMDEIWLYHFSSESH